MMHMSNVISAPRRVKSSTKGDCCCQRRDLACSHRPPLAEPSITPSRTLGAYGRRGLHIIMFDGPDSPAAACVAPGKP
jgi:hypothetical protein